MGIRKRGNAWQIVIDVGTKEQRQQKVFTFRGTKPEARAEEARLKAMYKMGTSLPGKMTVS
ncbi:MAG TPA: site-specific integrase, partial [Pelotomaculum sp.]|nr:site-specific integrase [Pelotomaculum sp.]